MQAEQAELLVALARLPGTDPKEQERFSIQAVEILTKLLAAEPSQPRLLFLQASTLIEIAILRYRDKRYEQALRPAAESIGLFRRLAERDPEDWISLRWACYSLGMQGSIQQVRGQRDQARASYREAAAVGDLGVARLSAPSAERVALLRRALAGFVQLSTGRESPRSAKTPDQRREVVEAWLHGGELDDQMALFPPDNVALRTRAAEGHRIWLSPYWQEYTFDGTMRPEEADESYRRAVAHYDALVKLLPSEPKYRHARLKCFEEWGKLMKYIREYRRAEKAYAQLAVAAKAERDRPPGKSFHVDVYVALRLQAEVVADQGRYGDACALLRQALRESTRSMSVLGKTATMQHNHALLLRELAVDEMLRKDHAAGFAALNECFSLALTRSEDWWKAGKLLVTCQARKPLGGWTTARNWGRGCGILLLGSGSKKTEERLGLCARLPGWSRGPAATTVVTGSA